MSPFSMMGRPEATTLDPTQGGKYKIQDPLLLGGGVDVVKERAGEGQRLRRVTYVESRAEEE